MRFHEDEMSKLTCSDGVMRDIHIWQPENPKAVLVAIHGGMAHAGDYCTLGLSFKERGYATVSYDMHGHDRQEKVFIPSFEVFIEDLRHFIDWTKEKYPDLPLVLVGHSMGALILTHYGLKRMHQPDPRIKGFVMSSPYYANAIKLPALMETLSGVISSVAPKMTLPVEDFTDFLTHDAAITARHHQDEADKYRASSVSARFGRELLVAQQYVQKNIRHWQHPIIYFIAGDDKLANPEEGQRLIAQIDAQYVTSHFYPENYHENFNELNREEIFDLMEAWIEERI